MMSSGPSKTPQTPSNLIARIQMVLSGIIALLLFWITITLTVTASRLTSEDFVKNAISEGIDAGISAYGINFTQPYVQEAISGGIQDGVNSIDLSNLILKAIFPEDLGSYVNTLLLNENLQATFIVGSVLQYDFGEMGTEVDNILNGDVVKSALSKINDECKGPDCFKAVNSVSTFVNAIGSIATKVKNIQPPQTSSEASDNIQPPSNGGTSNGGTESESGTPPVGLGVIDAVVSFVKSEMEVTKWTALAAPCQNLYTRLTAAAPSNLTNSYQSTCVDGDYFYYNGASYYYHCDCPIGKIKFGTFCFSQGISCTCEWNDDNYVAGKILPYMDSVCSILEAIPNK